jgi:hypothetical protein
MSLYILNVVCDMWVYLFKKFSVVDNSKNTFIISIVSFLSYIIAGMIISIIIALLLPIILLYSVYVTLFNPDVVRLAVIRFLLIIHDMEEYNIKIKKK